MRIAQDEAVTAPGGLLQRCADPGGVDWRSVRRLMGFYLFWAVCFVGASQVIKRALVESPPLLWAIAALPSIAGALVVLAYVRFLRDADELQRVIHLGALAVGFGVTFFAVAAYRVFVRIGAPALDFGDVTMIMAVTYTVALFAGIWRYR